MHKVILVIALLVVQCNIAFAEAGKGNITFSLKKAGPVVFSHEYHTRIRGVRCAACHFQTFSAGNSLRMKQEKMTKRDFCGHCHNGLKGFDAQSEKNCTRCHAKNK